METEGAKLSGKNQGEKSSNKIKGATNELDYEEYAQM